MSAFTTMSPSRCTSTWPTPWVEGCAGPMLTTSSSTGSPSAESAGVRDSTWSVMPVLPSSDVVRALENPRVVVVLAQRMALEVRRQHDASQVRVAVEDDAEQVEDLALLPVRRGPQRAQRVDMQIVSHDLHLH